MSADVDKIKKLLDEYFEIKGNIVINPDTGIVDVIGEKINVFVELTEKTKINTLPVQFGRVAGYFYCGNNKLTSLQGAPTNVGGSFDCHNNQLTSLEHAPTNVGGDFSCTYNQLTSLEHAPTSISGSFYCNNNQLTSLQGAPTIVGRDFDCNNNQLTSLQGAPRSIRGSLTITVCPTTPLLRILLIQGISSFHLWDSNVKYIDELNYLFKKYYPQGRQGILKCGLEMMSIKNGKYADNARMGPK